MSGWQLLTSTWDWQPTVLAGCAGLLAAYLAPGRALTGRFWIFLLGVLTLMVALVSPVDTLGDRYLFSAHMLQHLLLILVVPPLLLLGIPPAMIEPVLARPAVRAAEHALGHPALAWPLGISTLWLWHLPVLYDAALVNGSVHIVQHLSFLVTSTIFWWPVLGSLARYRLSLPIAILYLFSASIASSVLGIILTFAPAGLYWPYQHPVGSAAIVHLLRDQWGFDPASDQQVGGLLMWVPGGLTYLVVICGLLARWYGEPDLDLASDLALPREQWRVP